MGRSRHLSFPTAIREFTWLFPTIETIHVLALVLVLWIIIVAAGRWVGFTTDVLLHAN
jgi:hypothetical protein